MENPVVFDIPEGHFVHTTDTASFLVRASDGEAVAVLKDDQTTPLAEWKADLKTSVAVKNPEGFNGHPDHDRDHPHHQLTTFGIDPKTHFIHWDAAYPTVIRRADGEPVYRLVEGRCEALT